MMRKRSGWPAGVVVAPRRLDRAFQRLGAGIGEEHPVGEGRLDQPLRQPPLLGHLVEIGCVPQLAGLFAQGLDQMRMGMAQRAHRDAAAEIEIALAARVDEPRAFPVVERDVRARIGIKKRRLVGHLASPRVQTKKAARCGGWLVFMICPRIRQSRRTSMAAEQPI
jgi:hypothetical protein